MNTEIIKSDELTLKEAILKIKYWAKYLISKWYIIILVAGIGAAYGLYKEYYIKPIYKARISFLIVNSGAGGASGSSIGGLASQFGLDVGSSSTGETFSGANLQELMTSRAMIQKTLLSPVEINGKTQSLADYYIEIKGFRKDWANTPMSNLHFLPGANPELFTLEQNSLMNNMYTSLSKKELIVDMKNAGLSKIEVKSENELFAKYFAEVLLKVVSDFYITTKTKKSFENFMILKTQVDSMRRVLNVAVSNVATSIDANPNQNRALTVLSAAPQRKQIDLSANQAFYVQMIQNLESAKITLRKEAPLVQVIDRPVLPLEVSESNRKAAFLYGGIIGAILTIVVLIIRKLLKEVLAS